MCVKTTNDHHSHIPLLCENDCKYHTQYQYNNTHLTINIVWTSKANKLTIQPSSQTNIK